MLATTIVVLILARLHQIDAVFFRGHTELSVYSVTVAPRQIDCLRRCYHSLLSLLGLLLTGSRLLTLLCLLHHLGVLRGCYYFLTYRR